MNEKALRLRRCLSRWAGSLRFGGGNVEAAARCKHKTAESAPHKRPETGASEKHDADAAAKESRHEEKRTIKKTTRAPRFPP
jgi:hypothetical protein